MKVRVFQIFYKQGPNGMMPVDANLAYLAEDFAKRELTYPIDFLEYRNLWAACEVDDEHKPTRCLGLIAIQNRIDCPLFRFVDNVACKELVDRVDGFLHDQGFRGQPIFVHLDPDSDKKTHCPDMTKWMEAFDMVPARRWIFTVR